MERFVSCGRGILAEIVAEFLGSFYMSFMLCSGVAYWPGYGRETVLNFAVLCGLCLSVVTHCTSTISDGFINPVVTVALYLTQRITRLQFFLYIPAQVIGGIVGAAFQLGVSPKLKYELSTRTRYGEESTLLHGFVIEFALAILFVFALFIILYDGRQKSCNCGHNRHVSWKIGLVYSLCVLIDLPYTSGNLIPSWNLGLSIVRGTWGNYGQRNHWVYWMAPILGGAFGGTLYEIWSAASELNDLERYGHFKRMIALLVMLVLFIIVAIVITLAL